ncbi:MAG: YdcF family protein [Polyangiaceae bacterium]|nr:YdcF family protein [Polyangiaceae bacterium]
MPPLSADVIVVLGARVLVDGSPDAALRRRLERAADLFRQAVAPVVVCSGGRRWHGYPEALSMRRHLLQEGVPERAIVLEPFARTTSENAFFAARILRLANWSRVVLVSCGWHLPRAARDFARCGVTTIPVAAQTPPASRPVAAWRGLRECACSALDAFRLVQRFPR